MPMFCIQEHHAKRAGKHMLTEGGEEVRIETITWLTRFRPDAEQAAAKALIGPVKFFLGTS